MGYEDRDYIRATPRFGFSPSLGSGTKALLIVVIAGYIAGLIVADTTEFAGSSGQDSLRTFWAAATEVGTQQYWARQLFVLTASDIAPWVSGYSPGYWKLLTSWIVAPSLLVALIDAFIVYFVGKSMESALGTRRFLTLFVGSCALSALFAGVVDPLLMPGAREIVIMGPAAGIAAALVGFVWIAPNRPWIMNWPMKRVMLVLLGLLLAFNLIMPLVSGADIRLSPTRMLWAAGIGALFMLHLKNQGRLPRLDAGPSHAENKEPWSSEPAWRDADEPPADTRAARKARKQAERRAAAEAQRAEAARAEQARLDQILDKISREGITALSAAEKKFLDSQSKRKKDVS